MNYYEILGINRKASLKEIKKAYRKLALKWHPDKNQTNKEVATKKFNEITEAYDTLQDDTKRKNYDMFGTTANGQSQFNINPDEIFRTFFGGKNVFQVFQNEHLFNFNIPTNQTGETVTKKTYTHNGDLITKITKTKNYPDGSSKTTEEIQKQRIDASIRERTPTNTNTKTKQKSSD